MGKVATIAGNIDLSIERFFEVLMASTVNIKGHRTRGIKLRIWNRIFGVPKLTTPNSKASMIIIIEEGRSERPRRDATSRMPFSPPSCSATRCARLDPISHNDNPTRTVNDALEIGSEVTPNPKVTINQRAGAKPGCRDNIRSLKIHTIETRTTDTRENNIER